MKLVTWNVNSIRARQERALGWLAANSPDVVCLQETKVEDSGFPFEALTAAGYHAVTLGQRSYNGVAILSREPVEDVLRGFDDGEPEEQARVIAATLRGVRIVGVYVPNGQALGSDKYVYKLAWFERLGRYIAKHSAGGVPLVLCGDMNVAPEDRDVHDPKLWRGKVHCSEPERAAMAKVLTCGEMVDAFRIHNQEAGHYSWWDYRGIALFRNLGLRIDHIFATPSLAPRITECTIDREARKGDGASDHAPVIATISEP